MAFYNCSKLFTIYNYSSLELTKGSQDYGYVSENAKEILGPGEQSTLLVYGDFMFSCVDGNYELILYSGTDVNLVLPESIENIETYSIAESCFVGRNFKTVYIPDCVTEIKAGAFGNCSSLQYVIMHNSVEKIAKNTFYYCTVTVYYVGTPEDWQVYEDANGGSWGMSSVNPSFYSLNNPSDNTYSYWYYEGNTPVKW